MRRFTDDWVSVAAAAAGVVRGILRIATAYASTGGVSGGEKKRGSD